MKQPLPLSVFAIGIMLGLHVATVFSAPQDGGMERPAGMQTGHTVILRGTVRDMSTNEPLVFATISIDGTHQGTTTDSRGAYSLGVRSGQCTIRCSFVGYKPELFPVSLHTDAVLDIALRATDVILQDVTVIAHRLDDAAQPEVNALTLQSETIKHVTSLIPDVMRSVQMLPGVSTNNEFSSKFNVRGGNQDENLVVVNGTQVYDPFHVKEASNVSIGIFNADMIRKMDLITGGFTARYGDKLSSVVNIEYREGSRERYTGALSISLMDLNGLVEGPLGENASFIIGARKSYLEYVMNLMDAGPYMHPSFYDIQGVFAYAPRPGRKLMFKFIHSGDDFHEDPHRRYKADSQWSETDKSGTVSTYSKKSSDTVDNRSDYYSNMAALQYTHILSSDALVRTEVSLYDQRDNENYWYEHVYAYEGTSSKRTVFYNSSSEHVFRNALHIRTLEMNTTLDLQIAQRYGIKAGLSYQRISYAQDLLDRQLIEEVTNQTRFPDTTRSIRTVNAADEVYDGIDTRSYKTAGYIENILQVSDRLLVNAGARGDYFDLNKDLTWSPRVNVSYNAGRGLVVRSAWGRHTQSPIYRQIASPAASDTNTRSQHAVHFVLGIDYELALGQSARKFLRCKAEWFKKTYGDLVTASVTSAGVVRYTRKNDASGDAGGIDVQLIYSAPGFYGWISYGYLKARQTYPAQSGVVTIPRYTDQRHTVAIMGEFDYGKGWSMNARYVYGSGYPYTPSRAVLNTVKRTWEWKSDGVPNSEYLPAYSRVDVKIARGFRLFGTEASAFSEVSNLFNSANIQSYRYRFDSQGSPYREDVKLWPILPSLGLSVRF